MKHSTYWQVLQHLHTSCKVPSVSHSIQSVTFFAFRLLRLIAEVTEVGGPLIPFVLSLEVPRHSDVRSKLYLDFLLDKVE